MLIGHCPTKQLKRYGWKFKPFPTNHGVPGRVRNLTGIRKRSFAESPRKTGTRFADTPSQNGKRVASEKLTK